MKLLKFVRFTNVHIRCTIWKRESTKRFPLSCPNAPYSLVTTTTKQLIVVIESVKLFEGLFIGLDGQNMDGHK